MKKISLAAAAALVIALPAAAQSVDAINCKSCAEWNKPQKPFKLAPNTWYVGTEGLSSVLVTSPQGHVLIDGALPQSAPLIIKNIKALGFRIEDVKLILNSHAHWDHAGGIAALQKASGAKVIASVSGAQVLRDGTIGKDDPQYDAKSPEHVNRVPDAQGVGDGEVVRLGDIAITAHLTPAHTPGSTTWTWRACAGAKCSDVVYGDSLTTISVGDFRYGGNANHPDISASVRATIAKVGALKCDVLVTTHPGAADLFGRLERHALADPQACRKYAASASKAFDKRLDDEQKGLIED